MPVDMPDVENDQDDQAQAEEEARRAGDSFRNYQQQFYGGSGDNAAMGRAYVNDAPTAAPAPAPTRYTRDPSGLMAPDASPAMGRAYGPSPDATVPMANSPTAKSLGEFATATGTEVKAPPSHLSQVAPSPQAPIISPDFAKTQEDLRSKLSPTPKVDPATGKVLDQYRPTVRARIGRAFLDAAKGFLYGGIGGAVAAPLEGAFGNPNAHGYYGRGAVNGQYFQKEAQRQQDVEADKAKIGSFEDQQKQADEQFKNQRDVYNDTLGNAYKQDVNDIRQQNADERSKQNAAMDELRQQANDLKAQLRSIDYDPQSQQFMRGKEVYTPKDFQEGAVLETQHHIQNGPYTKMWLKEQAAKHERSGGEKGFTARDLLRIKSYAKTHGIKLKSTSPDDISDAMTQQQVDEALSPRYTDEGDSMLHGDAMKNFKADSEVQQIDQEVKGLEQDRATWTTGLSDPAMAKQAQASLDGIDKRMQELTTKRNAIRQRYAEQQNKRQEKAQPQSNGEARLPDQSITTGSGKVFKVGQEVPGRGTIKFFSRGKDNKIHANF